MNELGDDDNTEIETPAIVPPSEMLAVFATFKSTLIVTAELPSLLPPASKV